MRTLGGAAGVGFGVLCAVAFLVVFVSKVRSGDAFAYGVMALLLLGAFVGVRIGRTLLRTRSPTT